MPAAKGSTAERPGPPDGHYTCTMIKLMERRQETWRRSGLPKYIAAHTLPQPATPEEISPLVQELLKHESLDAYWVQAWTEMNEEGKALRIFCEWNAKNVEAVKEVFNEVPAFPLDHIRPMAKFDSDVFRMPVRESEAAIVQ